MTTNNELHEGDTVVIKNGMHRGKRGPISMIGHHSGNAGITPLYFVDVPMVGSLVYLRAELEPVTPEESRGVV